MGYLLIGVAILLGIYLLFKVGMYLYRSILLNKIVLEIQTKYENMIISLDNDINSAKDNLEKWLKGDRVSLIMSSEDELRQSLTDAIESKEHFKKVNEIYIRLRERYIHDSKKFIEAVLYYKRYLDLRLKRRSDAAFHTRMLEYDALSFEEWLEKANEIRIMIEEAEKRLNSLLKN